MQASMKFKTVTNTFDGTATTKLLLCVLQLLMASKERGYTLFNFYSSFQTCTGVRTFF